MRVWRHQRPAARRRAGRYSEPRHQERGTGGTMRKKRPAGAHIGTRQLLLRGPAPGDPAARGPRPATAWRARASRSPLAKQQIGLQRVIADVEHRGRSRRLLPPHRSKTSLRVAAGPGRAAYAPPRATAPAPARSRPARPAAGRQLDPVGLGQRHGALDQPFQLAHVARPVVEPQRLRRRRRQRQRTSRVVRRRGSGAPAPGCRRAARAAAGTWISTPPSR